MKNITKFLEKLQNIHLFGKIREFNFYKYSLGKKEKFLIKELKMNGELIVYHEDKIKNYKNLILDSEKRIKNLKLENSVLVVNLFNVKKIKEI